MKKLTYKTTDNWQRNLLKMVDMLSDSELSEKMKLIMASTLLNLRATLGEAQELRHKNEQYDALADEYVKLRRALLAVEWILDEAGDGSTIMFCPWCKASHVVGTKDRQHSQDCQREIALKWQAPA
jgi:hypothetical protein